MAGIKHAKTSAVSDSADTSLVQPSNWNADHSITGAVDFGSYTHLADVINESTADAGVTVEGVQLIDSGIAFTEVTLDDTTLDIGEWTPTVSFQTVGDLSVAYSTQTGTYTRIGRLVFVTARIVTSTFTHTTASGNFYISGLPFTPASGYDPMGTIAWSGWSGVTTGSYQNWRIIAGATASTVLMSRAAAGVFTMAAAQVTTGSTVDIRASATYHV